MPPPQPAESASALRALLGWAFVLAAALVVALGAGERAGAQVDADDEDLLELGAEVYAIQCAQCHGASGAGGIIPGTDAEAPALAGRRNEVSVAYVDLVMRTGRMPPPASPFDNRPRRVVITDRERAAVVLWTAAAFDLPGAIPDVPPGEPSRGREVFATNCAQCHGSTGAGGVAGQGAWTPQVSGYDPIVIAEAIRVGPFEMPRFDEGQISDQEVGDIAAYLEFVEAEQGTPVLGLLELNPVFASGYAFLLILAVVLSLLWIAGRPTWFPDPDPSETRPPAAAHPEEEP